MVYMQPSIGIAPAKAPPRSHALVTKIIMLQDVKRGGKDMFSVVENNTRDAGEESQCYLLPQNYPWQHWHDTADPSDGFPFQGMAVQINVDLVCKYSLIWDTDLFGAYTIDFYALRECTAVEGICAGRDNDGTGLVRHHRYCSQPIRLTTEENQMPADERSPKFRDMYIHMLAKLRHS